MILPLRLVLEKENFVLKVRLDFSTLTLKEFRRLSLQKWVIITIGIKPCPIGVKNKSELIQTNNENIFSNPTPVLPVSNKIRLLDRIYLTIDHNHNYFKQTDARSLLIYC